MVDGYYRCWSSQETAEQLLRRLDIDPDSRLGAVVLGQYVELMVSHSPDFDSSKRRKHRKELKNTRKALGCSKRNKDRSFDFVGGSAARLGCVNTESTQASNAADW